LISRGKLDLNNQDFRNEQSHQRERELMPLDHPTWGGKRTGAGRKLGTNTGTSATHAWFRNLVRSETVDNLERLKKLRDQKEDLHVAYNATMAMLAYGMAALGVKQFNALIRALIADFGGESELSTVEETLLEGYASSAATLQDLNTRRLLGQQIDLADHNQCISSMVRIASRLGLSRRARRPDRAALGELVIPTGQRLSCCRASTSRLSSRFPRGNIVGRAAAG
jgi:hypothetical protein